MEFSRTQMSRLPVSFRLELPDGHYVIMRPTPTEVSFCVMKVVNGEIKPAGQKKYTLKEFPRIRGLLENLEINPSPENATLLFDRTFLTSGFMCNNYPRWINERIS